MLRLFVGDPSNEHNPFLSHEERNDASIILYHGTSSVFSHDIEQVGFCFDSFKRECGDAVCAIVDACKTLNYLPGGFSTASLITVNNKTVWFTPHYGLARRYASNAGSECIDGALRAAQGFLAFVRDANMVKLQVGHWESVLKGLHHAETQQVLDNLRDCQLVENLANEVEKAQMFLLDKTRDGSPVVYAVLGDFSTLSKRTLVEFRRRQREGEGIPDQRSSEVMVKEIVGRADFPNGITTGPYQKTL